MVRFFLSLFAVAALVPAGAQVMPADLSRPSYTPPAQTIPAARDIPFDRVMRLAVDARDTEQGIFRVAQVIPIGPDARAAGRITLLYPEWLPGNHAPRGEIEKLGGLRFLANGAPLAWTRDAVDVHAFHVALPADADEITAEFEFLSATAGNQGRVVMAPAMLNLRWHQVSLYPAGHYVRQIPVKASAIYPDGWTAATALRPDRKAGAAATNRVDYQLTDYDTLVDSPVFAGAHFKRHPLTSRVTLNVVADQPEHLDADRDHIRKHAALVHEAEALFGSRPYDRYDFLLALTKEMGGIGIEHHRSSENGVNPAYFTDWDDGPGRRGLLPHELVHSWNGKYRRPAAMWTPDYRAPVRGQLLWVYEGQTQFWGHVLAARSGLFSQADTLDAIAFAAAGMELRRGRSWRPLIDTTLDPIISARKPKAWSSWQRQEDYYNEGLLIWLEADQIIRRESAGARSLADFARAFFGGRDGDYGVVTYDRDDVIGALNAVQPYDWAEFIAARVDRPTATAPLNGLTLGGYRLAFRDSPTRIVRSNEKRREQIDMSFGPGLVVGTRGEVKSVIWQSPAFEAGMTVGLTISAVNGKSFAPDVLRRAIAETARPDHGGFVEIHARRDDAYATFVVAYRGGLRYPVLEAVTGEPRGIDALLQPTTRQGRAAQ